MNLKKMLRKRLSAYLELERPAPVPPAAPATHPAELTVTADILRLISRLRPVTGGYEMTRFGPADDGGYLVPDDLEGVEACFSPRVGPVAGFELDCAKRGIKVFLADHTVEGPPCHHELFSFIKKNVGALTSGDCMTMDDWVAEALPVSAADLLLQIDIEGGEYETFLNMSPRLMARFRVIVVEFHRLDDLWSLSFFRVASRVFEKILQQHVCLHVHPNNAYDALAKDGIGIFPVMEFTFIRRDRIRDHSPAVEFPHRLDGNNNPVLPPYRLPEIWYRA